MLPPLKQENFLIVGTCFLDTTVAIRYCIYITKRKHFRDSCHVLDYV